jgi:uncharacterized protein with von Willebrand factor type A (vWA) domain
MSGAELATSLQQVVHAMRDRGVSVDLGRVAAAGRALAAMRPLSPERVRVALRVSLCSSSRDVAILDEVLSGVATRTETLGTA